MKVIACGHEYRKCKYTHIHVFLSFFPRMFIHGCRISVYWKQEEFINEINIYSSFFSSCVVLLSSVKSNKLIVFWAGCFIFLSRCTFERILIKQDYLEQNKKFLLFWEEYFGLVSFFCSFVKKHISSLTIKYSIFILASWPRLVLSLKRSLSKDRKKKKLRNKLV
jgi:hypothetical protein